MISTLGRKKIEYILNLALVDPDGNAYGRRAATAQDIAEANDQIDDYNIAVMTMPPIPEDYAEFLMINDGYEENGMRFFGARSLAFGDYILSNLFDANMRYRDIKGDRLNDLLVIGGFDDSIYVYSGVDGKYYSLDSLTLIMEDEYDSFEDLFLLEAADLLFSTRDPEEEEMYYNLFDMDVDDDDED